MLFHTVRCYCLLWQGRLHRQPAGDLDRFIDRFNRPFHRTSQVGFIDNQPVLDLLERKGIPQSLLGALDETVVMPGANDVTFIEKLDEAHAHNKLLTLASDEFTVSHYAGRVVYQAGSCMLPRTVTHGHTRSHTVTKR